MSGLHFNEIKQFSVDDLIKEKSSGILKWQLFKYLQLNKCIQREVYIGLFLWHGFTYLKQQQKIIQIYCITSIDLKITTTQEVTSFNLY